MHECKAALPQSMTWTQLTRTIKVIWRKWIPGKMVTQCYIKHVCYTKF